MLHLGSELEITILDINTRSSGSDVIVYNRLFKEICSGITPGSNNTKWGALTNSARQIQLRDQAQRATLLPRHKHGIVHQSPALTTCKELKNGLAGLPLRQAIAQLGRSIHPSSACCDSKRPPKPQSPNLVEELAMDERIAVVSMFSSLL